MEGDGNTGIGEGGGRRVGGLVKNLPAFNDFHIIPIISANMICSYIHTYSSCLKVRPRCHFPSDKRRRVVLTRIFTTKINCVLSASWCGVHCGVGKARKASVLLRMLGRGSWCCPLVTITANTLTTYFKEILLQLYYYFKTLCAA